jgi:hypothetical protein
MTIDNGEPEDVRTPDTDPDAPGAYVDDVDADDVAEPNEPA